VFEASRGQALVLDTILSTHNWHAWWRRRREITKSVGRILRFHRQQNDVVGRPDHLTWMFDDG
jgi:hypothetical protein